MRAEALRVHRACNSDCKLHVIIQFTCYFVYCDDLEEVINNRRLLSYTYSTFFLLQTRPGGNSRQALAAVALQVSILDASDGL